MRNFENFLGPLLFGRHSSGLELNLLHDCIMGAVLRLCPTTDLSLPGPGGNPTLPVPASDGVLNFEFGQTGEELEYFVYGPNGAVYFEVRWDERDRYIHLGDGEGKTYLTVRNPFGSGADGKTWYRSSRYGQIFLI